MNRKCVLLVIADEQQQISHFRACLNSRTKLLKHARVLFATSETALGVLKTEISDDETLCGGFLDFSALSAPAKRKLIAICNEAVASRPDSKWVITHDADLKGLSDAEKIFGDGMEWRWDSLRKPFSREELLHKVARIISKPRELRGRGAVLMERAERLALLGRLSRGIGHEFGNILLKISGRAELALGEEDLERARQHLAIIASSAERGGLIVRNLQSLSKTLIQPEPIAAAGLLEEAVVQSLHAERSKIIGVTKQYAAVPKVMADKRALSQVFSNLVLNAVEAMPKGGRLTVKVSLRRPMIAISVADTGPGIPPEVMPRIFDFAFTTKGDMGTGLGLSISKQVIEAHGGEILIETAAGKGTRVTVLLPVASEDKERGEGSRERRSPSDT